MRYVEEHADTLTKLLESYLSEGHRDAPGTGCALGALLGDMSRASRSAKAVYTARFKRNLAYSTGLVPPNGTSDRRARAILMISPLSCRVGPKPFARDSPTDSRSVNHFEQSREDRMRRLMLSDKRPAFRTCRPVITPQGLA